MQNPKMSQRAWDRQVVFIRRYYPALLLDPEDVHLRDVYVFDACFENIARDLKMMRQNLSKHRKAMAEQGKKYVVRQKMAKGEER